MNANRYPELASLKAATDLRSSLGYSPMGDCERYLLARHYAGFQRRHWGTWDSSYWLPRIVRATHKVLGF